MPFIDSPLLPLYAAIADYANALAHQSDSSIDDAQMIPDFLLDLIDPDMRTDPDYDDLPAAIDPSSLDDLDRAAYDALRTAYLALLDSRP